MKFTCVHVHIREETYNMSHCFISRDRNDGTTRTKVSQIESSPLKKQLIIIRYQTYIVQRVCIHDIQSCTRGDASFH